MDHRQFNNREYQFNQMTVDSSKNRTCPLYSPTGAIGPPPPPRQFTSGTPLRNDINQLNSHHDQYIHPSFNHRPPNLQSNEISQKIPLSNGFASCDDPIVMPSKQLHQVKVPKDGLSSSFEASMFNPNNMMADLTVPQTGFRQLPSMTEVINTNNYSKNFIIANQEENLESTSSRILARNSYHDTVMAQNPVNQIKASAANYFDTHKTNSIMQLTNSNLIDGCGMHYENEREFPSRALRQLPIITPFGPKHIKPRSPMQTLNNFNNTNQTAKSQIDGLTSPTDLLREATLQYLSKNHFLEKTQAIYPTETGNENFVHKGSGNLPVNNQLKNKQTIELSPARKLPILTDRGVLKLRPGFSSSSQQNDHIDSQRTRSKRRTMESGCSHEKVDPSIIESDMKPDSFDRSCSLINASVLSSQTIESDDDHEYVKRFDNLEQVNYLNMTEVSQEDQKTNSLCEDINDKSILDHESSTILTRSSHEDENGYDEQDLDDRDGGISDEGPFYEESMPAEDIEEAEYYSALATMPEEEEEEDQEDPSKLSDKITFNENDRIDSGGEPSEKDMENLDSQELLTSSNSRNLLPTINENGFEAQVLEYLAERTGLRKSELFSVDEEPSSYNDDVDNRKLDHSPSEINNKLNAETATMTDVGLYKINSEIDRLDGSIGAHQPQIAQRSKLQSLDSIKGNRIEAQDLNYTENDDLAFNDAYNVEYDANNNVKYHIGTELDEDRVVDSSSIAIVSQLDQSAKSHVMNSRVPELTISADMDISTEPFIENQPYNDLNESQVINYDFDEEEQDRIFISPTNDKTSFDQEEYDEQYRDINNLDDIERRATNHVHAIDGHSKSMLNSIHQQRTINDYYDEGDFNVNDDTSPKIRTDHDAIAIDIDDRDIFKHDKLETEKVLTSDTTVDHQGSLIQNNAAHIEGFGSNVPRARIRWITAVNKIVNHYGERL